MKLKLYILITYLFVANFSFAQSISVGSFGSHTVVLHTDGTVYAWGKNTTGELGDNTTTQKNTPIRVLIGAYPGTTYLGDNSANKIIDIASGSGFTVALAADGIVYSWGDNSRGKLGDNSITERHTPVKVLMGAYSGTTYLGDNSANKIIAVAAGLDFAIALAADGTIFAWGANEQGQLGNLSSPSYTSNEDSKIPVKVLKGAYTGTTYLGDNSANKITAIATGSSTAYALGADGIVYAWGSSSKGELGINLSGFQKGSAPPIKVLMGAYSGTTYLGDNSANKITAISAGNFYAIALGTDGTAYSWGDNTSGILGDGTTTERDIPINIIKGTYSGTTYLGDNSSNKIISISAGNNHVLALVSDGTVYSWGNNGFGQLGNGSTSSQSSPIKVLKGAYSGTTYLGDNSSNKITSISAFNVFSIALATDNSVYTWGNNTDGNLGDNTTSARNIPVQVVGVGGSGVFALPVELTLFTALVNNHEVRLIWETATEVNNYGFEIEKSINNANWDKIGFVQGHGNSNSVKGYTFSDEKVLGGNYFYRLKQIDTDGQFEYSDIIEVNVSASKKFNLDQNYPNPFNPVTTIRYSIPSSAANISTVRLIIYNVLGKVMATLVNKKQDSGNYEVSFNADKLPSGIYIYRLMAGEYSSVRKMLLLK